MSVQTVSRSVLRAISLVAVLLSIGATAFADPAPEPTDQPVPEAPAEKTDGPFSFSGDMTVASRYLFQGFDYSEGRGVLQPNASFSYGQLTANIWGNYQFNRSEFNEIDVSLKVAQSFGPFSVAAGYLNLQYPNRPDWDPSQEMFTDMAIATVLSPTLSVHYDFDAGKGSYTTLGVSQAVGSSIILASNLFYQGHYYDVTGFPAAEFKISWQHSLGAYTLTPAVSYFATWANGDLRDDASVPTNWLFGLNVARSF